MPPRATSAFFLGAVTLALVAACSGGKRILLVSEDASNGVGGSAGTTSGAGGVATMGAGGAMPDATTSASAATGAGGEMPLMCSGGSSTCGSTCVDLLVDPANCGSCGNACPIPQGATAVCVAAKCGFACNPPSKDCNANTADGCEVNTSVSLPNCGGCGFECPASPPHAMGKCTLGTCALTCGSGFADCNVKVADGCESELANDELNCGNCGVACNVGNNEHCIGGLCKMVPFNYGVLETKDIVYSGLPYLLLKVKYLSDTSIAENWCQEYTNLCTFYGYKPTGCGQQFNSGGYGDCKSKYLSDGVSDSLGCNASGGVQSAAQQNGYGDAAGHNSFAFHYCSDGAASGCGKTMCSGQYCNSALSYFDYSQPFGYTLCKK